MLTWPHSGFHVHTAVWVPEDDRAFATRVARYCARNPVALERLTYHRSAKAVTDRSDTSEGPTAGAETADPLEFLARVLVHIPDTGHVTTRYYWLLRQPPALDAGEGGARSGGDAARDRPRATTGAPRGHPPLGGVAAADFRGGPPRPQRGGGHAAARSSVLARQGTTPYTRPTSIEFPSVKRPSPSSPEL